VRLVHAALDLFTEQGYDATTVTEIAERAGVTKMTFFRHFADKREVLFAGQELHSQILAEAIAAAPEPAPPLAAVAAAIDALAATFTEDRREFSARLQVVVAAHRELRERRAFKHIGLTQAASEALEKRGVPDLTASLAAELGLRAFDRAFAQWASDPAASGQPLTELTGQALRDLQAAAEALSQGASPATRTTVRGPRPGPEPTL
jgi:AcrR family transcriptional regulator